MVFSFIKNFITGIFYSTNEDQQGEEVNENEEELLAKITAADENDDAVCQDPSMQPKLTIKDPDNSNFIQCSQKTGKVTFLNRDYGLIDNELYFNPNQVPDNVHIQVNDIVEYYAFKATENQVERIFKISGVSTKLWDTNPEDVKDDKDANPMAAEEDLLVQAIDRVINGKVTQRSERKLYIDPIGIWCSLDDVEIQHTTPFVPVEGDWLSLGAKVTVDEDVTDLTGEILEIKTIRPLRYNCSSGKVTLWNAGRKGEGEGAIEREVYFCQELCERGYIPSLGDEVIYEKIESDQGDYHWRAISVTPLDVAKTAGSDPQAESELHKLLRDKKDIGILGLAEFKEVRINETKELTLEIKNFGKETQTLLRSRFNGRRQNSQISLVSPGLDDKFILKPGDSVKYVFQCKGRFVGFSTELFVFSFHGFKIGRQLEMHILVEKDLNQLLPTDVQTHYKKSFHLQRKNLMKTLDRGTDARTYGPKPKNAPKFIKGERPGRYRPPEKLYNILLGKSLLPKSQRKIMEDLENFAPFLAGEMQPASYSDWWHILLYIEEMTVRLELRRFDMVSVILRRQGDFLVLEVPGLQEQRPSLIIGDKVIVHQPWKDGDEGTKEHVGHIYDLRQKEVFIKFHPSFQDEYDESDCDVHFETNLSNLQKGHDAVNRASRKLGSKWLFPSSVQEKPIQLFFETIEDFVGPKNDKDENDKENAPKQNVPHENGLDLKSILQEKQVETEYDVDEDGYLIPKTKTTEPKIVKTEDKPKLEEPEDKKRQLKKRHLVWFNKDLNYQQKASVLNVLKGQGRPLPYIIFGPPGTGKTITLVETILQVYTLLPDSRILVGTPSNSSADLLCERIIDSGVLAPGELVRIVAYHRANQGEVPERLIPFSTTTDLRDDKEDPDFLAQQSDCKLKQSSLSQLTGTQRIIVGTCTALGTLHYMGFPPDHFSHIVIDEAGQSLEPEILIPISFLNPQKGQVILAGDPEQLGPICISKIADEYGLGTSLLQRFVKHFPYTRDHDGFPNTNGYDPRFITRLCINYRSIPEILDLPSQLFYNSELVPTISPTDSFEADICRKMNDILKLRDTPASIIFHGVRGQNHQEGDCPSWYNPQEIWECITYMKKCYSIGLNADHCGIITPYKKQVQKLRQLLMELDIPVPKIGTVEDFQGQERHVIILSAVRSSLTHIGNDIKHSLGFVASPRRLNVALTRARAILIIVGNPHLLSTDPYWRSALMYCVKNDSYLGCDLPLSVE